MESAMPMGDPPTDDLEWDDCLGWKLKRPLVQYIGPAEALDGFVMAPLPDWQNQAASIICGHDYINKEWPEEKMLEFEIFVREVLWTTAPPRT